MTFIDMVLAIMTAESADVFRAKNAHTPTEWYYSGLLATLSAGQENVDSPPNQSFVSKHTSRYHRVGFGSPSFGRPSEIGDCYG